MVIFRVFWIIAFLMSVSLAIYLIYQVWDRYTKVPVIVSFQTSEQDIDSIPFPAVTLCNMNKVKNRKNSLSVSTLYFISSVKYCMCK